MIAPFADADVAGVWCRQLPRPHCQPVIDRRIRGWPGLGEGVTTKRLPPGRQLALLPPFEQLMLCAFDNVASAIRRSTWQRFPLGPRRFGEDVYYGKRVIAAGLALAHQGAAVVVHSHDRSAWDEGRRTFCDHRNLHALFGLRGFATRQSVKDGIPHATAEHVDYVKSLGLPPAQEGPALAWTHDYVKWQCWGQYYGAMAGSNLPGWKGLLLRWLGRRLERGIG
jgi:hypothetical protein